MGAQVHSLDRTPGGPRGHHPGMTARGEVAPGWVLKVCRSTGNREARPRRSRGGCEAAWGYPAALSGGSELPGTQGRGGGREECEAGERRERAQGGQSQLRYIDSPGFLLQGQHWRKGHIGVSRVRDS